MANNTDHGQTQEQSNLGLYCLPSPLCYYGSVLNCVKLFSNNVLCFVSHLEIDMLLELSNSLFLAHLNNIQEELLFYLRHWQQGRPQILKFLRHYFQTMWWIMFMTDVMIDTGTKFNIVPSLPL